jgi:hypothetical protein
MSTTEQPVVSVGTTGGLVCGYKGCTFVGKGKNPAFSLHMHKRRKGHGMPKFTPKKTEAIRGVRSNARQAQAEDSKAKTAISYAFGRCEELINESARRSGLPYSLVAEGVSELLSSAASRAELGLEE